MYYKVLLICSVGLFGSVFFVLFFLNNNKNHLCFLDIPTSVSQALEQTDNATGMLCVFQLQGWTSTAESGALHFCSWGGCSAFLLWGFIVFDPDTEASSHLGSWSVFIWNTMEGREGSILSLLVTRQVEGGCQVLIICIKLHPLFSQMNLFCLGFSQWQYQDISSFVIKLSYYMIF